MVVILQSILSTLTGAGIGSRRRMADAIRQGRVTINGTAVENFRHPVNKKTDLIMIDGQPVALEAEPAVYLMLNKPKDILSTTIDERGRRTVMSLIPGKYRHLRLHLIGRLDKDSTGLLLLTNDGELTYRLTHPRFEHEKEYLVQIEGSLTHDEKGKLEKGLKLTDGITYPAKVRKVATAQFNYSITMHEGRKRQVRRMFAVLGHSILNLRRIRMGELRLGDLKEGTVRELSATEVLRWSGARHLHGRARR